MNLELIQEFKLRLFSYWSWIFIGVELLCCWNNLLSIMNNRLSASHWQHEVFPNFLWVYIRLFKSQQGLFRPSHCCRKLKSLLTKPANEAQPKFNVNECNVWKFWLWLAIQACVSKLISFSSNRTLLCVFSYRINTLWKLHLLIGLINPILTTECVIIIL